jgi:hypothetical protein
MVDVLATEEEVTCASIWHDTRFFPSEALEFKRFYIRKMKAYLQRMEDLRTENRWVEAIDVTEMTYRFILHHFDRGRFFFNNNLINTMIQISARVREQSRTSRHISPGRRRALAALFDELRVRCEKIRVG